MTWLSFFQLRRSVPNKEPLTSQSSWPGRRWVNFPEVLRIPLTSNWACPSVPLTVLWRPALYPIDSCNSGTRTPGGGLVSGVVVVGGVFLVVLGIIVSSKSWSSLPGNRGKWATPWLGMRRGARGQILLLWPLLASQLVVGEWLFPSSWW